MRRLARGAGVLAAVALLAGAAVWWLNRLDETPLDATASSAAPASAELVARGAYLARAGNCQGCHTAVGGVPYAGGRGVPTPFGTVHAPNLTPDVATGLGTWSAAEFWRALHNGRAKDGRLLYPAFPYPNYTRITRADSDALHAYLRSLPPTTRPNTPHTLAFPFDRQAALAVWRALYFRPGGAAVDPARSAEWNRGAYLVEGLGHCNACHASRNALGATAGPLDLAGGLIPVQNWYAPSLTAADEAGVAAWPVADIVALLRTGVSARSAVAGPMGEVVAGSTQHLSEPDLNAMAAYLKALPQTSTAAPAHARPAAADSAAPPEPSASADAPAARERPAAPLPATAAATALDGPGAKLYERHCASCHGDRGEGAAGVYPPLAGNRAVTMRMSANLVHLVLEGGFPPSTAGNPRPFGMPPFATVLSNDEVAQVLSHVRGSWGNRAAPVSALDVTRFRRAD
jgi:mono/diheme cytochrome c family protein